MDYIIRGTTLTDIADAIRSKNGTTSPILTEKMADAIRDISGGNANTYEVSSFDELPNDAPNGSVGIVENSDSLVGKWRFYETPNFEGIDFTADLFGVFIGYGYDEESRLGNLLQFANYIEDDYRSINIGITSDDVIRSIYDSDEDGWSSSKSREIEILSISNTSEQSIQVFKSNAERLSGVQTIYIRENDEWVLAGESGGSSSDDTDDSIVGTWRFNETLTPLGRSVEVKFISNSMNFNVIDCTEWSGGDIYYSQDIGDEDEFAYDGSVSNEWADETFRTIIITEEPTDAEFITWLKANATKYENIVGTWELNNELSMPLEDITVNVCSVLLYAEGYELLYKSMSVGSDIAVLYSGDYQCLLYDGGWEDDCLKQITFITEPDNTEFITWLKSNATKII